MHFKCRTIIYFKNIFKATCHSKLEKADILEMTVRYLRSIKSIQGIYPSPAVFADTGAKTPGHPNVFGAMRNLENVQMLGASRSQLVAAQIQAAQAAHQAHAAAAMNNQFQVAQSQSSRIPVQPPVMVGGQPIKAEYFPTGQFNPNLQKNRNEFKKSKVQKDSFSPISIDSDSSSSGSTSGALPVNNALLAETQLPIGSKRRHSDMSQESDSSDYDSIDQNNTGLFRPYML